MYLKVDIPEHFQFRIVRSLKDMLLRKETEIHYIGGAEVSSATRFRRKRKWNVSDNW